LKRRAAARRASKKTTTRGQRKNKGLSVVAAKATRDAGETPQLVHLSISQAAEEFGRHRQTVAKRIRELGIQASGERQGYPVYRLRDLLAIERTHEDGAQNPDKLNPFERQAHFKAESERLKVDLERGELLRREDVEQEWARVVSAIALELDTVVDEIERDVGASPLVCEKIEEKLDVIRERMYQRIHAEPVDGDQADEDEPDAGPVPAAA
jgi:predicted metal-dependent phosphoesterase TrpH